MPMRTLLCLQDRAPFVAPRAEPDALARIAEALDDLDAPALPGDFAQFLAEANGFVWNGIEIFGSERIVLDRDHSVVPALAEINDSYHAKFDEMRSRLVIGRAEDDLYVFDDCADAYLILDRRGFEEAARFPTFAELLRHIVAERK
jgi:hypothetical protein